MNQGRLTNSLKITAPISPKRTETSFKNLSMEFLHEVANKVWPETAGRNFQEGIIQVYFGFGIHQFTSTSDIDSYYSTSSD